MRHFKDLCIILALPFAIAFVAFIPIILYGIYSTDGILMMIAAFVLFFLASYLSWKWW